MYTQKITFNIYFRRRKKLYSEYGKNILIIMHIYKKMCCGSLMVTNC